MIPPPVLQVQPPSPPIFHLQQAPMVHGLTLDQVRALMDMVQARTGYDLATLTPKQILELRP